MASQNPAAVARGLYDALNARDFDRLASYLAEDVEWTTVAFDQTHRGRAAARNFLEGWVTAFPDGRAEVTFQVADENAVTTEFIFAGAQNGTLSTPDGEIAPTGRAISVPSCEVYRVRDGQIVACRTYFDLATLLRQLGAGSDSTSG